MIEVRELPLAGWTVEQISFDFQTRFMLLPPAGQGSCDVILESRFLLLRGGEG